MKSDVYFTDTREHHHYNIYDKVKKLLKSIDLKNIIKKNDIVAVKIHFGEYGNTSYIKPPIVRIVIDEIKALGGKPFLTDGSTLYKGSRSDAVNHLQTAILNGFDYSVVNAPLVIADGIKGNSCVKVKIDCKHTEYAEIGSEPYYADALVVLTHFKLHELTGIGGSLKNIAMGLAAKSGKLIMHSSISPSIKGNACIKCMSCKKICPADAMVVKEKCLQINQEKCVGCAQCIMICPVSAINIVWNAVSNDTQEKICEFAKAVLSNKTGKSCFINFLYNITPECDCYSHSDTPIVQDIGILASTDITAIDKASIDLLNSKPGLKNSALKKNFEPGENKVAGVYPELDWTTQINYAAKIGLGNSDYNLINLK
ncbi:DUF362 domain-containing protein [Candidatus Dependentiae bacterium]|nr:DUF362 domain-containing protein [Candidatus Dependentiae bacterium]